MAQDNERRQKMPALTHVSLWDEHGWRHITEEEAAAMNPKGTVSAHSGLFMCELCWQYVTFTKEGKNRRYFKHSSSEESKDCPDRTQSNKENDSCSPLQHDLPVRFTLENSSKFKFEIGLIQVPYKLLNEQSQISIYSDNAKFVYNIERISNNGITYLDVGGTPSENYHISYENEKLECFWPHEIAGIKPSGSIFDGQSRKLLTQDADVEVNKEYYLLSQDRTLPDHRTMLVREKRRIGNWILYIISANKFDEVSAKFFLHYKCRLTEQKVSIQTIWPLYSKGPYIINHEGDEVFVHIKGNTTSLDGFPANSIIGLSELPNIKKVRCSERQQLVAAKRNHILEYAYLWKNNIGAEIKKPVVSVKDMQGKAMPEGIGKDLPPKGIIGILVENDGEVIVYQNDYIKSRYNIKAETRLELDNVHWGTKIEIVVGLDILYSLQYTKNKYEVDDLDLLSYVIQGKHNPIKAPEALKNIAAGLKEYSKIYNWIMQQIKLGWIDRGAYRRLQQMYIKMSKTNRR